MLRSALATVLRVSTNLHASRQGCRTIIPAFCTRYFSSISNNVIFIQPPYRNGVLAPIKSSLLLDVLPMPAVLAQQPARSVTKFSLTTGKRKTVKAVIKRFKRLHWGAWIRTRTGRHKKMWRKSAALKKRLRQHIFVNGQQSTLLDKMVTKFWRRPKYYLDDPYTPYHTRTEFHITKGKASY